MFKTVKVNFYQKNFDSWYRNFLFDWNQGNYLKYVKNRIQWYLYPNLKKTPPFPLHMDIETTAMCNLRCPMCGNRYISDEKFKNYSHMDMSLYKRLVDECAENKIFSVRLSWRGEVFINPQFLECVYYAKVKKKIPQVSFLTNGMKLKGEIAEQLIDFGVDYISVSVDGIGEVYERIRSPSLFKDIYRNLHEFRQLREKKGRKKPLIRVSTLWPAIANNPKEYYEIMSKVSDRIVFNPLKDFSITGQDRHDFTICQFLFERLFIGFDGTAHPCSNTKNEFIIGDVNKSSIGEVWQGDRMKQLRQMHKSGKRLEVFPCSECSYGVDYEKRWRRRDWTNWGPKELLP